MHLQFLPPVIFIKAVNPVTAVSLTKMGARGKFDPVFYSDTYIYHAYGVHEDFSINHDMIDIYHDIDRYRSYMHAYALIIIYMFIFIRIYTVHDRNPRYISRIGMNIFITVCIDLWFRIRSNDHAWSWSLSWLQIILIFLIIIIFCLTLKRISNSMRCNFFKIYCDS